MTAAIDAIWSALAAHRAATAARPIAALFETDPTRADTCAVGLGDMRLDWSKTAIDSAARALLLDLAHAAGVTARREAMFAGEAINETEGRAVLHTALRSRAPALVLPDGTEVLAEVRATRARMADLAEGVRAGRITGPGGAFTDVVNIGIGGSDLGPAMAVQALAPDHDGPRCHFVSNVDGAHVADTLRGLDPTRTLVIIASKTFTTIETMTNAATVRDWMEAGGGDPGAQTVALSSATDRTAAFGIPPERVFGFADWVGGRYSVWGPIGLALMLAIGPERFEAFLDGAAEMDDHFRTAPPAQNMPLMLALVGLWHHQVCGYPTRAVLPYDQRLSRLPAYLQQLEMESNGKRVAMDGTPLPRPAGPVVWGEPGTNGQHAFMQLVHQGTGVVPCEFLVAAEGHEGDLDHQHRLLVANCLAQSAALMRGRTLEEARAGLAGRGLAPDELERQARHRVFPGNRSSTTLIYRRLDAQTLGRIIALYEHRVFVEGVILGINSFDQWGVELGKELADTLAPQVAGAADAPPPPDPSTAALLAHLHGLRAGRG